MSPDAVDALLSRRPRTRLARLPTPLRPARNLPTALGRDGVDVWIKHDDETGFGLGGNKVRKLEFVLPPDELAGATHLVTTGGPQSNHCRVAAAAAAHLGLRCVLVVNGGAPEPYRGNALLHRLFGAEVRTVEAREDREPAMEAVGREVREGGGRAILVPLGASTPEGALGYVAAAAELARQLDRLEPARGVTRIYLASSSAGTLGGLAAGFALLDRRDVRLVGVSADASWKELRDEARRLAAGAMALLGAGRPVPEELIHTTDDQVGEGYGIPTPASDEATALLGAGEGVVLDPVYTAKAAAEVVRALRNGAVERGDRVVFLHTGGHPALFT